MYNPTTIRPKENWLIVLDDMKTDKVGSGLLYKPSTETNAEKVTEGAGTVIRVGKGDKITATGIEAGNRVVYRSYLKFANPVVTDEVWPNGLPKQYFLMSIDDIMGIVAEGVEVGVYSGRPQVPSK